VKLTEKVGIFRKFACKIDFFLPDPEPPDFKPD